MIRINLLPFRAARRKENVRRQASIFILSLVLVFLTLGVVHFWLGAKQSSMVAEVTSIKKEIESYKEKNTRIQELEKKLQDIAQRTQVIQNLEKNRFEPVHLLDQMTSTVVESRMWVTRLSIRDNTVSIGGLAVDNQTVADFMDRLQQVPSMADEKQPMFQKVNLRTLKLETVRNTKLKSFQIDCDRQQAPAPAPATK